MSYHLKPMPVDCDGSEAGYYVVKKVDHDGLWWTISDSDAKDDIRRWSTMSGAMQQAAVLLEKDIQPDAILHVDSFGKTSVMREFKQILSPDPYSYQNIRVEGLVPSKIPEGASHPTKYFVCSKDTIDCFSLRVVRSDSNIGGWFKSPIKAGLFAQAAHDSGIAIEALVKVDLEGQSRIAWTPSPWVETHVSPDPDYGSW